MIDIPTYLIGAVIGATVIQIAPIKIDPWTWLFRWIGRWLNQEVMDELESVKRHVDLIEMQAEKREAISSRNRIIRFSDEILHSIRHSKEHFDQILRDCTCYERYCDNHEEFENGVAVESIKLVKATYEKCLREKDFL